MQEETNGIHVYQAWNAVQSDLATEGISKDSTNTHSRYKFRGIDALYQALTRLLSKHNLIIAPVSQDIDITVGTTKSGGVSRHAVVKVDYIFISALDGSQFTTTAFGEASDTSDKAVNKAFTAAYKYLCFQAFCIPVEGNEDADASTPELGSHAPNTNKKELVVDKVKDVFNDAVVVEPVNVLKQCTEYSKALLLSPDVKHLQGIIGDIGQFMKANDVPENEKASLRYVIKLTKGLHEQLGISKVSKANRDIIVKAYSQCKNGRMAEVIEESEKTTGKLLEAYNLLFIYLDANDHGVSGD